MPRSYPYQGYQTTFNRGTTYPYARSVSDEEENELEKARELYKNLTNVGGWETRSLRGSRERLQRRLGDTESHYQRRMSDFENRLQDQDTLYRQRIADFEKRLKEEAENSLMGMESMREGFDRELGGFASDLNAVISGQNIPEKSDYFGPSDYGKSQMSFASSIVSRQALDNARKLYDRFKKGELDLNNLTNQYNLDRQNYVRDTGTLNEQLKNKNNEMNLQNAQYQNLYNLYAKGQEEFKKKWQEHDNILKQYRDFGNTFRDKIKEVSQPGYGFSMYAYNPALTQNALKNKAILEILSKFPNV